MDIMLRLVVLISRGGGGVHFSRRYLTAKLIRLTNLLVDTIFKLTRSAYSSPYPAVISSRSLISLAHFLAVSCNEVVMAKLIQKYG